MGYVVRTSGAVVENKMVENRTYPFESIALLNRLDMEIEVDICPVYIKHDLVMIVKSSDNYHRSTVSKNIEQIAFQLRKKFIKKDMGFSVVEYTDRHQKRDDDHEEWWQWRFNWVGNTALDGQRYLLSGSKIDKIKIALLSASSVFNDAM